MMSRYVDIEEVKHGEWVHEVATLGERGREYHRWTCSCCGRTVARLFVCDIKELPYCHCGAKMTMKTE